MTNVTLSQSVKGFTVKARGHATGSPEMCAAVSCLIQTAAGWLRNTDSITIRTMELGSGKALLKWRGGDRARWLWELLEIGFLQLELTAPEYIHVERINAGNGLDNPERAMHGGDTPAKNQRRKSE